MTNTNEMNTVATTEEKKVRRFTKKEYFGMLDKIVEMSEAPNKDELREFIAQQVKLLENKNSSEKPKNKVNEVIKQNILYVLSIAPEPMTISEMLNNDLLSTYVDEDGNTTRNSSQKLTALLKQLDTDKLIVITENKKKRYFSIA